MDSAYINITFNIIELYKIAMFVSDILLLLLVSQVYEKVEGKTSENLSQKI